MTLAQENTTITLARYAIARFGDKDDVFTNEQYVAACRERFGRNYCLSAEHADNHLQRISDVIEVLPGGTHFRYYRGFWAAAKWWLINSTKCMECNHRVRIIGPFMARHRVSVYCARCDNKHGYEPWTERWKEKT